MLNIPWRVKSETLHEWRVTFQLHRIENIWISIESLHLIVFTYSIFRPHETFHALSAFTCQHLHLYRGIHSGIHNLTPFKVLNKQQQQPINTYEIYFLISFFFLIFFINAKKSSEKWFFCSLHNLKPMYIMCVHR